MAEKEDCFKIVSSVIQTPYSAKKVYFDRWKKSGCPEYAWPYYRVAPKKPITEEALYNGLRTTVYRKYSYLLGVDGDEGVTDHQLVHK